MSQPDPTIIEHGGYLVDTDTGLIVGHVKADDRFQVLTKDHADWVLSLIMDCDVESHAITTRKQTLIRNLEAQEADVARRRRWLEWRFKGELETWMRANLKRGRHIKLDHGRLSLRRTRSRIVVEDETRAIEWAKQHRPEAVRTSEHFLVSALDVEPDAPLPAGCRREPESERFSIVSGIESDPRD